MYLTAIGNPDYPEFLVQLKARYRQRQYQVQSSIIREFINLNLKICEAIYQAQVEQVWGKVIVETAAHNLQAVFPGRNGLSAKHLRLKHPFCCKFNKLRKIQPQIREINWTKYLVILGRIKDPLEREFHLRTACPPPDIASSNITARLPKENPNNLTIPESIAQWHGNGNRLIPNDAPSFPLAT